MRFLLLASLILTSVTASGAGTAPSLYMRSNRQLVLDGQSYSPQFLTGRYDLGDRLDSNPEAAEHYRLHRKWGVWGSVFLWGSIVTLVTYSLVADHNNTYDGDTAILAFWLPEFLIGAISMGRSQYHLVKAINIYNGIPANLAGTDRELRVAKGASDFAPSLGLKFTF